MLKKTGKRSALLLRPGTPLEVSDLGHLVSNSAQEYKLDGKTNSFVNVSLKIDNPGLSTLTV